jgi:hypothetical protein
MRADYTVMARGDLWAVHEAQSDQVIREFPNEMEAQKYRKFLSRGGAFNGYTPAFMLNEEYRNQLVLDDIALPEEEDINRKFEKIIFKVEE